MLRGPYSSRLSYRAQYLQGMGLEALAGKLCLNHNAMVSAIACSSVIVIMYLYLSSQVPGHTTNSSECRTG